MPQKGGLKNVKSKNIALKALLVLNNAPGQPQDLCLTYLNIKAKNLSNQTTSLLQLLKKRVITKFKHCYTCHISSIISDEVRARHLLEFNKTSS